MVQPYFRCRKQVSGACTDPQNTGSVVHGSSWICVLVVKVTTGRSWRIPTFWNHSIIVVRMAITLSVRADCLIIRQHCVFRQHIGCSGKMALCNCVEFDNLTLNFSVGTKLSIAEYFPCPACAHSFITIFWNFWPGEKISTWRKGF